jgi:uridine phosphorylase
VTEADDFLRPDRRPAVFDPADYVTSLGKRGLLPPGPPPDGTILCYQRSVIHHAEAVWQATRAPGGFANLYLLPEERLAVTCGYGIGAPAAAATMEELIAFGCRRFVSIGIAGSLQADVGVGDLVLCTAAFCDEGTSPRYGDVDRYVRPSAQLSGRLRSALHEVTAAGRCSESAGEAEPRRQTEQTRHAGHTRQAAPATSFRRVLSGPTWTVDAAYRETVATARELQGEGVLTVEMEASALFTVAAYRGVEIAAAFSVSDSLSDLTWTPDFANPRIDEGLELLFAAARVALAAREPHATA